MFRKALSIMVLVVVAGLVGVLGLSLVAAQEEPGASRSFNPATVAQGGQVVVTISATGYGQLGGVTETLPAGFSYVSSSLTGAGEVTEVDARTVRFTLQGADKTFTYTVTASDTAGGHDFSGSLRDADRVDHVVVGATRVTVEAASEPTPSARRSFNPATVAQGGQVTVTITANDYGQLGGVTETLPAGFSYVSSSLTGAGEVTEVDARTIRFTLQGADKTFIYTVTASDTAGGHDFSGSLRDADRVDHVVGGATRVTVEAASEPTPSARRSFNLATVAQGGQVTVTITANDYGQLGGVTETLPAGFSYVSSSLTDAGEVTEVDTRTIRFTLQGADKTFTYTVTASDTAGGHDFSGSLRDADRVDHVVVGASRITVRAPQPVPTPRPQPAPTPRPPTNAAPVFSSAAAVSVAENTTAVVTVRATDPDSQDRVTGYTIQRGGADWGKFSIVAATGELSFKTAPDFENPADAGADNEYVVSVRANSGAGSRARTAAHTILVTVTDVVEGPALNPYDVDDSGVIEGPEVIQAVKDYFDGTITGPEVIAVVKLYFVGRSS